MRGAESEPHHLPPRARLLRRRHDAGFSNFDLPEQGTYYLDGPIVVATFTGNDGPDQVIQLDTRTGSASVDAQTSTYILDTVGRWGTLQFDSGVECPSAP